MAPQDKNVCQLVWHLYLDTAAEGSELYCYDTEGDTNLSVRWLYYNIVPTADCGRFRGFGLWYEYGIF